VSIAWNPPNPEQGLNPIPSYSVWEDEEPRNLPQESTCAAVVFHVRDSFAGIEEGITVEI